MSCGGDAVILNWLLESPRLLCREEVSLQFQLKGLFSPSSSKQLVDLHHKSWPALSPL